MNQDIDSSATVEFVGVVYRFGALLADGLIIIVLNVLLVAAVFGENPFASEAGQQAAPVMMLGMTVLYVLACWLLSGTSPGKWFCSARIVDFRTGQRPPAWRMLLRFAACLLSAAPLLLGFWWAARNPYKRAWHDRIAGTAVIADDSLRPPSEAEQEDAHYCIRPAPWASGHTG